MRFIFRRCCFSVTIQAKIGDIRIRNQLPKAGRFLPKSKRARQMKSRRKNMVAFVTVMMDYFIPPANDTA
jgi:hypothetical protein